MFFYKKTKKIALRAGHISGSNFYYYLPAEGTSLKDQQNLLDEFLMATNEILVTNPDVGERSIFLEFGDSKIRANDFSSFTLLEIEN